jgi:hypothetical protein
MDIDDSQRVAMRPQPPGASWISGPETHVFEDHSGRRARGLGVAAVALAALCAFWLAGLAAGMAGSPGFRAGRLAVGDLRAATPARAQAEARELASASATGHVREVDAAANDLTRSACPRAGIGARAGSATRSGRYLTNYAAKARNYRAIGRLRCLTKRPIGLHHGITRLT